MQIDRYSAETTSSHRLNVSNGAPYETVLSIDIGDVSAGDLIQVYGEAQGNPLQKDQIENAWVTGITIYDGSDGSVTPCFYRGQDLEKNRKNHDCRIGTHIFNAPLTGVRIEYRMRAVNKASGGYFEVLKATLGALVFRTGGVAA